MLRNGPLLGVIQYVSSLFQYIDTPFSAFSELNTRHPVFADLAPAKFSAPETPALTAAALPGRVYAQGQRVAAATS